MAFRARRVDVFSLKGGVGKTTLSILLARAQKDLSNKSVLIVDADLTGSCIGDLLEFWATPLWPTQANLSHLVCGPPETLDDLMDRSLPVYVHRMAPPVNGDLSPRRLAAGSKKAELLFCPSHAESTPGAGKKTLPEVRRRVLQALVAHENAGGFVGHVIDRLIERVGEVTELGGVIVDHGPGLAALQSATLTRHRGQDDCRSLFVTSRDAVDLAMIHEFEKKMDLADRDSTFWVVNRTPAGGKGNIDSRFHRKLSWFQSAFTFLEDDQLSEAYANAGQLTPTSPNIGPLEELRAALFG